MSTKVKKKFLLILVIFLAVFFRFFHLSSVPPGLYPDEAVNANQGLSEPGKIFYPENNGREGLFINLLALSFKIFGPSIWILRSVPALFGVLTVLGLYLLAKELFSEQAGLASAFLLALSFWHVNFSRTGFRAVLVPFFLVFTFYFLLRGLKTKNKKPLLIAGIFYGLGFHTYIAYRVSVLLLAFFLFSRWKVSGKKGQGKPFLKATSLFLGAAFLTALPIGIYFLAHPAQFVSRAGGVSVFVQKNPIKAFGKSLVSHLGMFHFKGDPNWRHNLAGRPVLFWPAGFLFAFGLLLSIKRLLTSLKPKNLLPFTSYLLPLTWLLVMLLPGALTTEAVPHSLRTIGAIPAVFLLAGLGFSNLKRTAQAHIAFEKFPKLGILLGAALFLFVPAFITGSYSRYFFEWAQKKEVKKAFSRPQVKVGKLLNGIESRKKYVVVNQTGVRVGGLPVHAQTPMFIEKTRRKKPGQTETTYIEPDRIKEIEKGAVVIPLFFKRETALRISKAFPKARIKREQGVIYFKTGF